jgi:threonine dehydratase
MQKAIDEAYRRILPHVRRTPCKASTALGRAVGSEVFLKLENLQESGSFKMRGVANKVLSLTEEESARLLVAASTGNHGMAFAHAVRSFGLRGKLFLPRTTAAVKLEALRGTGIPFDLIGDDCVEAEAHAAAFARENGGVWVSPYNDPEVIHGQGTVAVELTEQIGTVDTVLVPVGGGGLISGVAGYLKAVDPSVTVLGCQPGNSCAMWRSIQAGEIVSSEESPTVSDGTAGGIEPGSVTFDLCRELVDEFILLDEEEIVHAIRFVHEHEGMAVEGAAALSVAALLRDDGRLAGRRVVAIVSGGRIDEATLRRIGVAP